MPDYLKGVSLDKLGALCAQVFSRQDIFLLESEHIAKRAIPVEVQIDRIHDALRHQRVVKFSDFIEKDTDSHVIVVTFLAILELFKQAKISLRQDSLFGDIAISYIDNERPAPKPGRRIRKRTMDAFEMRDDHDLKSALEAMLFVTSDPIETEALSAFLEEDVDRITVALKELQETYQQQDRGIQLNERAGGWQLVTHPRYHELLEQYVVSWDKRKLSQAALETLAIVAYCQPVTRNDVSAIRGVSSDSSLNSLLEKGYLREVGVTEAPSNATLYGTTKMFLERFGLRSIAELPDLESFAPDEATRNLISERLGFVKEQAFSYEVEEENDQEMLEALTGALGAVEKIDLESISFDEE